MTQQTWSERFENRFYVKGMDCYHKMNGKDIKQFISQELNRQREEIKDEVKKMKKRVPFQEAKWMPQDDKAEGYNDALTDVLNLLK